MYKIDEQNKKIPKVIIVLIPLIIVLIITIIYLSVYLFKDFKNNKNHNNNDNNKIKNVNNNKELNQKERNNNNIIKGATLPIKNQKGQQRTLKNNENIKKDYTLITSYPFLINSKEIIYTKKDSDKDISYLDFKNLLIEIEKNLTNITKETKIKYKTVKFLKAPFNSKNLKDYLIEYRKINNKEDATNNIEVIVSIPNHLNINNSKEYVNECIEYLKKNKDTDYILDGINIKFENGILLINIDYEQKNNILKNYDNLKNSLIDIYAFSNKDIIKCINLNQLLIDTFRSNSILRYHLIKAIFKEKGTIKNVNEEVEKYLSIYKSSTFQYVFFNYNTTFEHLKSYLEEFTELIKGSQTQDIQNDNNDYDNYMPNYGKGETNYENGIYSIINNNTLTRTGQKKYLPNNLDFPFYKEDIEEEFKQYKEKNNE